MSTKVTKASPILCTGIRENTDTDRTYYALKYLAHTGAKTRLFLPSVLVSPLGLFKALSDRGYVGSCDACDNLLKKIQDSAPPLTKVTSRGGWIGSSLVTRFGTFGSANKESVFDREHSQFQQARREGTCEEFKIGSRDLLSKSPEICFAYLAALAAPLGAMLDKASFSVCFSSESTTGKTSIIAFAQSLASYSFDDADLVNFGDTLHTLLDDLDVFGGLVTGFADIKNAAEKDKDLVNKLQTLTFSSASSHKRRRAGIWREETTKKRRKTFNLFLLSAERPLSDLFRGARMRREGGDSARFIEIPIPNRSEGGIFAEVPENERDGYFTRFDELRQTQYGTIMPEWCAFLSREDDLALKREVKLGESRFTRRSGKLEPLHRRIGMHFAFLDSVIEIAERAELLPISKDVMHTAIDVLFERIVRLKVQRESEQMQYVSRQLKRLVSKTPFPLLKKGTKPKKMSHAKICFRRRERAGKVVYFHAESFLSSVDEVDVDRAKFFVKWLMNTVPLITNNASEPTRTILQTGLSKRRYICFTVVEGIKQYKLLTVNQQS